MALLYCKSVYSINSFEPTVSTGSILQVLKDCGQTLLHAIFEFSILTFTKCGRTEALVWLEYLGVIQWRVSMTIIASMDVGCTLLYGEIPPSLVTGNRAICVNISDVVISVGSSSFFRQELDLCVSIACLPLLTFQSFPTVTGYLSHCLVCGIPEGKKRTPLFHPPQTCFNPNCCLLCYLNLHRRKWRLWRFSTHSTETCFYPSHFLSGLACSNVLW